MKRACLIALLTLAGPVWADNQTRALTRGLADALYCKLAGTCTVQTLTVTGTCTGCGGAGTVTSVSVASANGFAGTVATATTTPALTLSTTITGLLKGNGTAISAATAGTDYSNGTSALATGILKSTTTTGGLTIAVAGDFPTLNQSTSGNAATASAADHTPTACAANTFAQSQSTVWSFTCAALTLAGAQFANQGTTTTVAHGNAAGNPSWAKVVDGDTTFTTPTLGAPTATTLQTSGNIGFGQAPSATAGVWGLAGSAANQTDQFQVVNTDAADTGSVARFAVAASTAQASLSSNGAGRTTTRFGVTIANYSELLTTAGSGLIIGATGAVPLILGTNSVAVVNVASGGDVTIVSGNSKGQCTLNGAATSTCTHTVPSGCTPICTYNSASTPHTIACSVTTTTLTAVSATTLDSGVVNYHCF
jgi:hypothetical protein